MTKPKAYNFDQFFLSGLEPSVNPFLSQSSQKWGKSLSLKNGLFALGLLLFAHIIATINQPFSYFSLTVIYFLLGTPAILKTSKDIFKIKVNINVLMTLAAFLAILIGSPYEGALLLVLFALANALTEQVAFKTKSAIHELNKINPTKVLLLKEDDSTVEKSIKEIAVGDLLLIKAGEIVPLDSVVISGSSSLNLEHLTGEATPVLVKTGDEIPSGAKNQEGAFKIKVLKTFNYSTLNTIIRLIQSAQNQKPKIQTFFDSFSKAYALTIIGLTAIFAFTLPLFFDLTYFGKTGSFYRALAFLIASSPCALILAVPAAYLSSISSAAKKGIILKGGIILDALASIKKIAFDKTGTLTQGSLKLLSLEKINDSNLPSSEKDLLEQDALAIAASLEQGAKHPIANAITEAAQEKKLSLLPIENLKVIPGYGVEGELDIASLKEKTKVFLGHPSYLKAEHLLELKKGSVFLFIEKNIFAFQFEEQVKSHLKELILKLKKMKLSSLILTGDSKINAQKIAEDLKLDEYYAELKPEDKLKLISQFSHSSPMAMVGDGINDAPALAKATVGISMGQIGSATAVDASDVILIKDNLQVLPWLFKKSYKTQLIVKENILLALSVIVCASLPALLGWIPLWVAVLLHEGGTVLVGLNGLRLLRKN